MGWCGLWLHHSCFSVFVLFPSHINPLAAVRAAVFMLVSLHTDDIIIGRQTPTPTPPRCMVMDVPAHVETRDQPLSEFPVCFVSDTGSHFVAQASLRFAM